MEKIEGIDLAETVEEVRKDLLQEQRLQVQSMVRGILNNIRDWQRQLDQAKQTIAKRTQQIEGAQAKLTKIRAGDWSVLKEEQPPGSKDKGNEGE